MLIYSFVHFGANHLVLSKTDFANKFRTGPFTPPAEQDPELTEMAQICCLLEPYMPHAPPLHA